MKLRAPGARPTSRRSRAQADVDVVLTGTLLRAGSPVRVTAQLIEVPAARCSGRIRRRSPSTMCSASGRARASASSSSLELPLTAREHRLMHQDVPASPRAYEWYLRARASSGPAATTGRRRAGCSSAASPKTASYAPAWARLGRIYRLLAKYGRTRRERDYGRAEAAFQTRAEINPGARRSRTQATPRWKWIWDARPTRCRGCSTLARTAVHRRDDLFAGLVLACRYSGLLDASLAAHHRARLLDPLVQSRASPHLLMARHHYRRGLEESLTAARCRERTAARALRAQRRGDRESAEEDEARLRTASRRCFARQFRFVMLERVEEARAAAEQSCDRTSAIPKASSTWRSRGAARRARLARRRCWSARSRGGFNSPLALTTHEWLRRCGPARVRRRGECGA